MSAAGLIQTIAEAEQFIRGVEKNISDPDSPLSTSFVSIILRKESTSEKAARLLQLKRVIENIAQLYTILDKASRKFMLDRWARENWGSYISQLDSIKLRYLNCRRHLESLVDMVQKSIDEVSVYSPDF